MSAGVCGKRVGFEEIFGSSSPTSRSSAKRTRWSSFGSTIRSEFGSGSDDDVSVLLQMFPALDPEVSSIRCQLRLRLFSYAKKAYFFEIFYFKTNNAV